MRQIILASASPRRKKLLESIGILVKVVPSEIEEKLNPRLKAVSQAEVLSLQKAEAVSKKYTDSIILAADTLVFLDEVILGKPKTIDEAKRMLRKLSGKSHSVVTGYTIIDTANRRVVTESEVTKVFFKKLSKIEIDRYVKKEKVLDKAGAYAIQGIGSIFIEKIEGDYSNVVGLSLFSVARNLKRFGIEVFQ